MINDIEKLKDKKSNFVLIIGILIVIVVVLWLIIFFSKHDSTNPAKGDGNKNNINIFVINT